MRLNDTAPVLARQIKEALATKEAFRSDQGNMFATAIAGTTFDGTLFKVYGDIADELELRPQFNRIAQGLDYRDYDDFVEVITPIHRMYIINTVARISLRMRAENAAPDLKVPEDLNVFTFLKDPDSPRELTRMMNADLPEFYVRVLGYHPDETLLRSYADSTINFEALYRSRN